MPAVWTLQGAREVTMLSRCFSRVILAVFFLAGVTSAFTGPGVPPFGIGLRGWSRAGLRSGNPEAFTRSPLHVFGATRMQTGSSGSDQQQGAPEEAGDKSVSAGVPPGQGTLGGFAGEQPPVGWRGAAYGEPEMPKAPKLTGAQEKMIKGILEKCAPLSDWPWLVQMKPTCIQWREMHTP